MANVQTKAREAALALRRALADARALVDSKGRIPLKGKGGTVYLTPTPDDVYAYEEATERILTADMDAVMNGSAVATLRALEHFGRLSPEDARALLVRVGLPAASDAAFAAFLACKPRDYDGTVAALLEASGGDPSEGAPEDSPGADGADPNE